MRDNNVGIEIISFVAELDSSLLSDTVTFHDTNDGQDSAKLEA